MFAVDVVPTNSLPLVLGTQPLVLSTQPLALNTLNAVQTTSQNHSGKPMPHKVDNELKVEIKQELISPNSSQRNSVQQPVEIETKEDRTSQKQGEEESKLPQENLDVGKSDVNQGEMEVCKTEANSEHGAGKQIQPSTEEPMEAVVQETEASNSVSLPVEEEKMEVDEGPKLSAQHEEEEVEKAKEDLTEKAKEDQAEKVEEKKMKSPKGDSSHEHKAPAVVELSLPKEVEQEKDADEQNGEEEEVSHVPCAHVLATTAASQEDTKPESVSVETSSVQPEVIQPTPENIAPTEEKQEVQKLMLTVALIVPNVFFLCD